LWRTQSKVLADEVGISLVLLLLSLINQSQRWLFSHIQLIESSRLHIYIYIFPVFFWGGQIFWDFWKKVWNSKIGS
jgi:hypothetical protein